MRNVKVAGYVYLLLFLCGCAATRITHSWKAENVQPKKFNKLLVLGLNSERDLDVRERMEDHLVGDLKELGYNAVSSLREFGPKTFRNMDEEAAIAKLQNSDIDAVITFVLLDKSRERRYVPGQIYYSPYVIYHRHFWGYYTTIYNRIYMPGYYTENTRYFWESNLYDLSTKELICSIQTESFDPASLESLAHENGKLIVGYLVDNHILTRKDLVAKDGR